MAGDARQQKLVQNNTDLVAALVAPERIQEIISRRTFGGGWVGALITPTRQGSFLTLRIFRVTHAAVSVWSMNG